MKTLVIGDVHGCFETLEALLDRCGYAHGEDRLWFTGDLVNRGPRSLDVLRFVSGLGDAAVSVLGNHDAHLVARAAGLRAERAADAFDEVLAAPDRDDLLDWLRRRPLMHRASGVALVHAGLLPSWTLEDAERHARAIETVFATGDGFASVVSRRGGGHAKRADGRRAAFAALTRLRACTPDGTPDYDVTVAPEALEEPLVPWFDVPDRRNAGTTVIFGHWAALGVRRGADWIGLDAGCAWGRELAALHLEEDRIITVPRLEPT